MRDPPRSRDVTVFYQYYCYLLHGLLGSSLRIAVKDIVLYRILKNVKFDNLEVII